jgi:hypothetical protein
VANTGGEVLSWGASAIGYGYTINPSNGSIYPGSQVTVTVSQISQSGTVTVTGAPGTRNSPQTVSIQCILL